MEDLNKPQKVQEKNLVQGKHQGNQEMIGFFLEAGTGKDHLCQIQFPQWMKNILNSPAFTHQNQIFSDAQQ